jgi:hypothetical protein
MTTAQVVFANNAATVLASTLPATGITVELAPGTGILFPQLTVAGEFFMATLISQSNSLIRELVQVTAISGDTIVSMIRAQEGTSAISWVSGDFFQLNITAGSLAALQTAASAGSIPIAQVGAPNGVAPLDGDALVPVVNIPVSGLGALLDNRGGPVSGAPSLFNIVNDLNNNTVLTRHWNPSDGTDFYPAFRRAVGNRLSGWGGRLIVPATQSAPFGISQTVFLTPSGDWTTQGGNLHVDIEQGAGVINNRVYSYNGILYNCEAGFVMFGNRQKITGGSLTALGAVPPATLPNGFPSNPIPVQSGVNYYAAIYHLGGNNCEVSNVDISTYQTCIGSEGGKFIDNSGATRALNFRVIRNHMAGYSFGLLCRVFDGLYFEANIGEGASLSNPNPPHFLYITDRGEPPFLNVHVLDNLERNNNAAASYKVRNCDGGVISGNQCDQGDSGIQVEYSTNILIGPNQVHNVTPGGGDDAGAAVRLVDSWRCTIQGGLYETSQSTALIEIQADEKNTGTYAATSQVGMTSTQFNCPVINANYAIAAASLPLAAGTNSTLSGCWIYIVAGTGAGQWNQIQANPSVAKNAAVGVLTMVSAWTTQPDATSTFHIYDPTNGHHTVRGVDITAYQYAGSPAIGKNVYNLNEADFCDFIDCGYGSSGNDEATFPFYVNGAVGTRIWLPRSNNVYPTPASSQKIVTVGAGAVNSSIYIHPALWIGATATNCAQDNGVNTSVTDLSAPASVNLSGLTQNITWSGAPGTYNVGSGSIPANEMYSQQFSAPGTNSDSTTYQTFLSPTLLVFGAAATSYVKLTATGSLAFQFNSVTSYSFTSTTISFAAAGAVSIGSSANPAANVFTQQLSLPGVNSDTTSFTTSLSPTQLSFSGEATAYIKTTTGGLSFQEPSGTTVYQITSTGPRIPSGMILSGGPSNSTLIDGSGFHRYTTATNLVSAGTGQSTATPLTQQLNELTNSSSAGNAGFVLGPASTGLFIVVINADTVNAALIYPFPNASINALAANVAYSLAAGTSITFKAIASSKWFT